MAKHYQDFVGLNTFIYEVTGYDTDETGQSENKIIQLDSGGPFTSGVLYAQNHIGHFSSGTGKSLTGLSRYKNHKFDYHLPSTASFFNSLLLKRNGPYGFSTFKQIRANENILIRKQIQNNVFTIIEENVTTTKIHKVNERSYRITDRYGDILKYTETPISDKTNPLELYLITTDNTTDGRERLVTTRVKNSFLNNTTFFNSNDLNYRVNAVSCETEDYNQLKEFYLNESLCDPAKVSALIYKVSVFPPRVYSTKCYSRQRKTFIFNWRDKKGDRQLTNAHDGFSSRTASVAFSATHQFTNMSKWPLDGPLVGNGWNYLAANIRHFGFAETNSNYSGILQNRYSQFANVLGARAGTNINNYYLRPAPQYFRWHMLTNSSSVVGPSGMGIVGINSGSTMGHLTHEAIPSGDAQWEAPKQYGSENNFTVNGQRRIGSIGRPFYDSYDDYSEITRLAYKGYGLIPEYRSSEHFTDLLNLEDKRHIEDIFEVTGGKANAYNSSQDSFYKIYSNSDFLKNFDVLIEENKDLLALHSMTMTCKAVKKLTPYNGFYPAQRTVQIAEQFYENYKDDIIFQSGTTIHRNKDLAEMIAAQNVMTPLFAPGVLFNSIKAGIACDYPIITGSSQAVLTDGFNKILSGSLGDYFENRVPFEALLSPERFLNNVPLVCNEPHPSGAIQSKTTNRISTTSMNSPGHVNYKRMVSNFLAETPNFFLNGSSLTTIASKNSIEPNVSDFKKDTPYCMRVRVYKTTTEPPHFHRSGSAGETQLSLPQYGTASRESFTMYSRPSAFGPPSILNSPDGGQGGHVIDSRRGENYPFTPPYYDGESWADIIFMPRETRKYTVAEIHNSCSVYCWRYYDANAHAASNNAAEKDTNAVNRYAMQVTSSFNLFQQSDNQYGTAGDLYNSSNEFQDKNWGWSSWFRDIDQDREIFGERLDNTLNAYINLAFGTTDPNVFDEKAGDSFAGINVPTDSRIRHSRWIIQPKWETPMFNFNKYSEFETSEDHKNTKGVLVPTNGSQSVPRGMWHQYGVNTGQAGAGVYMQATEIPQTFRDAAYKGRTQAFGIHRKKARSLIDAMGFPTEPKKLGRTSKEKIISEAIIAIPFLEVGNDRRFMKPRNEILKDDQGRTISNYEGELQMKAIMQKYVFPPSLDINNIDVTPYLFFFFEFSHTLSSRDLSNIWQNIAPRITHKFEHDEKSWTVRTDNLDDFKNKNLRWMVFKVKKRALADYSSLVPQAPRSFFRDERPSGQSIPIVQAAYNWPYDYFSLVELANIDVQCEFRNKKTMLAPVRSQPISSPNATPTTTAPTTTSPSPAMMQPTSYTVPGGN